MAIYSLAAVGATGFGPTAAGFVEMNPHLQWRWIQWIHMMLVSFDPPYIAMLTYLTSSSLNGAALILIIAIMKETRSTVMLTRLAKKMRKETGDVRYRARAEDEIPSLRTLLYISCTRPLC